MIPRFKPYLGKEERRAVFRREEGAVRHFEDAFAHTFEARYSLAFPYGRSSLWAFFQALGIENAEVILPAYTCVVVAHAVVLSNNRPRFVDCTLDDYNMALDQVEAAINPHTRVIVATHLFGYPLNVDRLTEIVRAAETRWGHKVWVIQDCAHAFGARWVGKLVTNAGDAAFFGLGISKMMTSVFGGMLTTNDAALYARLRAFRDAQFAPPSRYKTFSRVLYVLATYTAFSEHLYGLVHWLEEHTPFLNTLTKAYHLDGKIHFPPDAMERMSEIEARVGLVQLGKYAEILRRRQPTAHYYSQQLADVPGLALPPLVEGATYSHYVVRVADRRAMLDALRRRGMQLGEVIDYSIPEMPGYERYVDGQVFPNSQLCRQQVINLPIHPGLTEEQRSLIAEQVLRVSTSSLLFGRAQLQPDKKAAMGV
jgi:dTDP-4-amino-4,6-dideoxygalactose transaminase